jgi:beta-lactamase class A
LSRRGLLVGAGALAALAACSSKPTFADPTEPLPMIGDGLAALERRYDAFIGVCAIDLDTRRYVTNRADDPFAMCSTFKAYASGRVLQRAQLGELQLTDAVTIEAADVVANSPITQPRVGQTMTIPNCAKRRCNTVTTPQATGCSDSSAARRRSPTSRAHWVMTARGSIAGCPLQS